MTTIRQKYVETRHTTTVGLLVLGLVFSPAVLVLSRPLGGVSISLAAVFTALCIASARFAWARDTHQPRMSVVTQPTH